MASSYLSIFANAHPEYPIWANQYAYFSFELVLDRGLQGNHGVYYTFLDGANDLTGVPEYGNYLLL
ncbi:hypothetical protein [Flagellimonas aurea]|uniref:hypothetical protein n=1 Tax=Flagellimonas aurea TaxID=2915619 RepID=UPI0035CEFB36